MNKTNNLKKAYRDTNWDNVNHLINYLKSIAGKEISLTCRRQNAFKTKCTKREEHLRTRCHIQNAAEYLDSIRLSFSKEQIEIVIADIATYVKRLDTNEDVDFILLSTINLPSAIHFDTAKNLFYTHNIREQHKNNYSIDLLTIYGLRLSLESRIKGLLGINYATKKGKPIGLSTFIKVSKNLKSVNYSKNINWTEIEWVNEWINNHIHGLIRPYPWIIHQAFKTLQPFVDPKEPVKTNNMTTYSFYSASIVDNENDFHDEVETALKSEDPTINIEWKNDREILRM